jgi:hypothetical protein
VQFHPQDNSVTHFIIAVNMMCININLFPILLIFNPLYYRLHLFFHLLDNFWPYQDPILKSIPTQWRLTRSPVKKLKLCHLNGTLLAIFVCKLYQWQEIFPILLLVDYIHTQHILQNLVRSFYLPICLGVIRCTKVQLCSQGLFETGPKSSCKH